MSMRFFSIISFFLAVPATVYACEGDCIVAITDAFVGNYSLPVHTVMRSMARQISLSLPSHPDEETSMGFLEPVLTAYHKDAYQRMETAIFPNYFHGKCLDDQGVEPAGCPNPDCPIVCGTPGSLVHHYPKLRYIAFNETFHRIQALCTPGTDTYNRVEKMVMDAADSGPGNSRRSYSRVFPRALSNAVNVAHNNKGSGAGSGSGSGSGNGNGFGTGSRSGSHHDSVPASRPKASSGAPASSKMLVPIFLKRDEDVRSRFAETMKQVRELFGDVCGGNGSEETNGLPECSWEDQMKAYILSYP